MKASALRVSSRILHKISGGTSDTAANELMVMPSRLPPSDTVVTRQTPVGNVPSDWRKERASDVVGVSPVMRVQEYMVRRQGGSVLPLGSQSQQVLPYHGRHSVPVQRDVTNDGIRVEPHALDGLVQRQSAAPDCREHRYDGIAGEPGRESMVAPVADSLVDTERLS